MQRLLENENETPVSFDLNDIFPSDDYKMETINAEDIPDSILSELLMNEHEIFPSEVKQEDEAKNVTSPSRSLNESNTENNKISTPRFRSVTKQKVDEIASKSVKKRTHKQTNWGVKVFKGQIFFQSFLI